MFISCNMNKITLLFTGFLLCICREIIRRKAVLALYKFYLIAPTQVQHIPNKFRKALCDKDPGVMTASLHIYLQMIQVLSFSGLLTQHVFGESPCLFGLGYRRIQKVTKT